MDGSAGTAIKAQYAEMMDKLRSTYRSGKTLPFAWRRQQLDALGEAIASNESRIVEALHADLGKPALEAAVAEVDYLTKECLIASKKCESWSKPRRTGSPLAMMPSRSYIQPEPLGVALIIGAWNYPVQEVFGPLAGAIAAGNCAVLKPSEAAPNAAELIREIAAQALDSDAYATVLGGAEETSALLEEKFDTIFYTGGSRVGRIVMEAASKHLTPVTLELGGKSPAIVSADADLDVSARRIVWGAFLNGGQLCVRPDHCLIEESVYEPFLEKLKETTRVFYGEQMKDSPDFARIVNERHFDRLVGLIGDSEVLIGGDHDREERYFAPTILRDVKPDAPSMKEEIFGPILPCMSVPSMDAAIDFINERDKPLALYLFAKSGDLGDRFVRETSSGTIMVNDTIVFQTNHHLPFGGVGESGMGAFHGQHTFDTFSHMKAVMRRPFFGDVSMRYPPYSESDAKLMRKLM